MPKPPESLRDLTEPELRSYFNSVADHLEEMLPPGPGRNGKSLFVLIVFDEDQIGQYVSNCERKGAIRGLLDLLHALQNKEDIER